MYLKRQMLGRQCEKRGGARRIRFLAHAAPGFRLGSTNRKTESSLARSLDRYSLVLPALCTHSAYVCTFVYHVRARISGLTEIKLAGLSERGQGFRSWLALAKQIETVADRCGGQRSREADFSNGYQNMGSSLD